MPDETENNANGAQPNGESISLEHPEAALAVLEADQLVTTKQKTRFGRRPLSTPVTASLWGLRIYVAIMMILVVVSVLEALHAGK
jgi:hypothetical protein